MAYSYGGWQDEFKGLTKETDFRGSAPPDFNTEEEVEDIRPQLRPVVRNPNAPIKRPTGLGAKDTTQDDTTENKDNINGVFKNIMDNTDPLVPPSASNMITERNTNLYIAQNKKRHNDTMSYLDKISQMTNPYGLESEVVTQGFDPQTPETFLLSDYYDNLAKEEASKSIFDQNQDLLGELYRKRNSARRDEDLRAALGETPKPLAKSDLKLDVRTGRKYDASPFAERVLQKGTEGLLGTQEFIDRTAKYYGYESKVPYGLNMATRISLGDLPPLSDDLDPKTGKYVGGKDTSGAVILNEDGYVLWSQKEGVVAKRVKQEVINYVGADTIEFVNRVKNLLNGVVQSETDFVELQEELGPNVDLELVMANIKDNKNSLEGLY